MATKVRNRINFSYEANDPKIQLLERLQTIMPAMNLREIINNAISEYYYTKSKTLSEEEKETMYILSNPEWVKQIEEAKNSKPEDYVSWEEVKKEIEDTYVQD